jgi:hypothetical protein
MKEMSLYQLYSIKEKMEQENDSNSKNYIKLCEEISNIEKIMEDTSATGGPGGSVGGMGAVVSAQPSGLAGQTIGTSWASGGGTEGSGDISVPYNPSGSNRMQQKIPVMGSNHGPRTGKKSREKKLDIKALKDVFARRQDFTGGQARSGEKKVMSFDDFKKDDVNTIKKESLNEPNDIVMVFQVDDRIVTNSSFGTPIIAFQKDVDNNKLSLRDGYFSGMALIGDEKSDDKGSVDFSSPFHKGQVLPDEEDSVVEELDFKFNDSISKSIVREHLDKYVSQHYNGKIVKIYYH